MVHTLIIAEAGVNHNGSMEIAKKLVDTAVEAGVDIIKFQTFKADKLCLRTPRRLNIKAEIGDGKDSQLTCSRNWSSLMSHHCSLLIEERAFVSGQLLSILTAYYLHHCD
jgi:sialic acid synthase SpsE